MSLKCFVIIEKEGKFLLIREAGTKWRGKWFLPGGAVKKGETAAQAIRREVKEEAGCEVMVTSLFMVRCYTGFFSQKVMAFFTGETNDTRLKHFEDHHSIEAAWFTPEEIRSLSLRAKLWNVLEAYKMDKTGIPEDRFRIFQV